MGVCTSRSDRMEGSRPLTQALIALTTIIVSVKAQQRVLINCDYNSLTRCPDLRNGTDGDLTWDMGDGPTPSQFTGPSAGIDSTYFIFIEAARKEPDQFASLVSNPLGVTGAICVDFYY